MGGVVICIMLPFVSNAKGTTTPPQKKIHRKTVNSELRSAWLNVAYTSKVIDPKMQGQHVPITTRKRDVKIEAQKLVPGSHIHTGYLC